MSGPESMSYKNFSDDAVWPRTFIDNKTYCSMTSEEDKTPWLQVPGFCLESVTFDFLHNCYLGVGRDFVASGIWLLIRQGVFQYDPCHDQLDETLGTIQLEMTATCKRAGFLNLISEFIFHFPPLCFQRVLTVEQKDPIIITQRPSNNVCCPELVFKKMGETCLSYMATTSP